VGDVAAWLSDHGYAVVFAWVAAEQLALPVPSEPVLLAAGALAGAGLLEFLLYDAVGALLWIGTYAGLGYLFSDEIERVAAHARHLGSWLIGLVFASLVLYVAGKYIRRQRFIRHLRIARITPAELKGKLDAGEAMMIVDLRHPLDFGADPVMVPGAVHLNPEELERRSQEIPHDRDVVLYCT
jgi:hypothetical protein